MSLSRYDILLCRQISKDDSVLFSEICKAVQSFFDMTVSVARRLPFDNLYKIYSQHSFLHYFMVFNIPFLGRIGPVYSLYLRWRRSLNEILDIIPRENISIKLRKPFIERVAHDVLNGKEINKSFLDKYHLKRNVRMIWFIDSVGTKKMAKQVLIKNNYHA